MVSPIFASDMYVATFWLSCLVKHFTSTIGAGLAKNIFNSNTVDMFSVKKISHFSTILINEISRWTVQFNALSYSYNLAHLVTGYLSTFIIFLNYSDTSNTQGRGSCQSEGEKLKSSRGSRPSDKRGGHPRGDPV